MKFRAAVFGAALLGVTGWSAPSEAVEVFFNGVKVTGLRQQDFVGCKVRFDDKGDVHITAKGYTVKQVADSDGPAKGLKSLKYSYFLVSDGHNEKDTNYEVEVFINGKSARKVLAGAGRAMSEVSAWIKPGRNSVKFIATKKLGPGKARASRSPEDYLRVLIGQGARTGATVNISKTLAEFRASAAKTTSFGEAIDFVAE